MDPIIIMMSCFSLFLYVFVEKLNFDGPSDWNHRVKTVLLPLFFSSSQ
jgi:hypothetical protein